MTLFDILKLGGGLAFFLYGMNMMSQSLTKLAGSRMEEILRPRLTEGSDNYTAAAVFC